MTLEEMKQDLEARIAPGDMAKKISEAMDLAHEAAETHRARQAAIQRMTVIAHYAAAALPKVGFGPSGEPIAPPRAAIEEAFIIGAKCAEMHGAILDGLTAEEREKLRVAEDELERKKRDG